jgi:diguanylate cyclase (GGDEF)-like protein
MSLSSGPLPVESREDLSSRILLAQNQILQRIVQGGSLSEGLAFFCKGVEEAVPGSRCCVTLLNQTDKTLKVVAAPRLPAAFVEAVDQITIGLGPGSCSAAAYNNETIVSADMKADSEWEGMRERVLESGLAACWSCPIRGVRWAEEPSGHDEVRVLGTVALYFEQTRTPSDTELQALEIGAALAGMTINTARTQESIGRQKLYDSVTELPNRKLFTQQLKQVLRQVNPQEHKLGILLVDLDHFKEVNDTFGYAVGDFLLQSVAGRLLALRRKTDILARFGDDEFSYLIAEIRDTEDMKAIAAEALEAVSAPHDFGGQKLAVSASIGGSLYPWDGEDAQTLLRNAENALYTAKKQGRGHYRLYAPTMGGYAFEKLQLKMALGHALENQELEVYYQPKVASSDHRIVGAEALTYWNHPGMGQIDPGRFIPLAEETGLIIPLGEWVLRAACRQAKKWRQAGNLDLSVSVNISAIQFREREFVESVDAILREAEISPSALELEVTETVAMHEVEKTLERMKELKNLGVQIAIDDFGTGYSSLAYLKRFPIDTLKIDKSFVLKTPQDKEDIAIVKAVIAVAHYLGLEVVAEGVETIEQAKYLRDEGCETLQGYHFSRAVTSKDLSRLLKFGFGSRTKGD